MTDKLNEISQERKLDYAAKAVSHISAVKDRAKARLDRHGSLTLKDQGDMDKVADRQKHLKKALASSAATKLTKEGIEMGDDDIITEFEQLDEVSKERLANYVAKAAASKYQATVDHNYNSEKRFKASKNLSNAKAAGKDSHESPENHQERLDRLKKREATAKSAVDTANKDIKKRSTGIHLAGKKLLQKEDVGFVLTLVEGDAIQAKELFYQVVNEFVANKIEDSKATIFESLNASVDQVIQEADEQEVDIITEFEQLDEISKARLGAYINKAHEKVRSGAFVLGQEIGAKTKSYLGLKTELETK